MPYFRYNDGGTVVQHYLSKILEEDYGLNVRLYMWSNVKIKNSEKLKTHMEIVID